MTGEEMNKIAILDFGSQYSQLITRRIREQSVFAELLPWDTSVESLKDYSAIILSGGPNSVYDSSAPTVVKELFELGIPVLGICYGMQLMGHVLGGKVEKGSKHEYGKTTVDFTTCPLFEEMSPSSQVWMSHGDQVVSLPKGFTGISSSKNTKFTAISDEERGLYGIQFHPEVIHTPEGKTLLKNFLFKVAHCKASWTVDDIIEQSINSIKDKVGNGYVLSALSGGVDSAVASALVHRAIGDRLIAVFVDQGTLRLGEFDQVQESLKDLGIKIIAVNARKRFLDKLAGITDPEQKRKIIGHEFIAVFEETAKVLEQPIEFFAQGTLYPDVIESAASHTGKNVAHNIKTHHNVGGLPERLDWELVEPLRLLFKDEVRKIGEALGLPKKLVWRQPFPGPGLAIRMIGEVTEEKLEVLRKADAIITQEIYDSGEAKHVWQYFGVLTGIRTVGVVGDARAYGHTIAIRAIESSDGMTADWSKLPFELLEKISGRITNEIPDVNRVVYDITSKPPATIEWE